MESRLFVSTLKFTSAAKAGNPFAWEVCCLGIEHPPYKELFPHHVKAYEDQFKK
jgi:hypothetical protein